MKKTQLIFSLLFACLLFFPNTSEAQDAREILQKMEDLTRGDASYSEVDMQVVRPRYTREISLRMWALGNDYSLILITAPARDRGIAYLKREKEIWNWIPSIDRMIKLPPSMMAQSWMGSDFTNDDLVRESSIIDDYTHRVLRQEVLDGVNCYVIELIPKPDKPIVWSKVLMWIAVNEHYQLKIEQFDERNQLANTIFFSEVKKLGNRTLPSKMVLVPENKKGHQTILIQKSIDFEPQLDLSFFSIQNLQRIK